MDRLVSADVIRFSIGEQRLQEPLGVLPFQQWTFPNGESSLRFYRVANSFLVRLPDVVDFEISSDGLAVQGWPAPGVSRATLEHVFLHQALPLALSRQGKLVLHASAVEMEGGCVAFLGASGKGKSTIAAAFASEGRRFLTDDGLQVEWRGDVLFALPSHSSLRLRNDSLAAVFPMGDAQPLSVEDGLKTRVLAGPRLPHAAEAQQVRALYFLGGGQVSNIRFERLSAAVAVRELIAHSFLLDIDEPGQLASHFDHVARIAQLGRHYHLDYPRAYAQLPQLRDAILRHVRELHSS